jgi:hypothetical protein
MPPADKLVFLQMKPSKEKSNKRSDKTKLPLMIESIFYSNLKS